MDDIQLTKLYTMQYGSNDISRKNEDINPIFFQIVGQSLQMREKLLRILSLPTMWWNLGVEGVKF